MQILRAAASSPPVLSREAELTLTRSIVAAHHDAWAACLGAECVRATRRAVLLSTACDVAGRPNALIPADATEVPLAEVANVATLARPADPDQHILRALQALVLTDCDDTWTSPRASAPSVRRAEAWRYKVLSTAATLRRLEERMVKHNIGLAMKHAHARVKSGVPVEDLIQEACVGLLDAVRRFDPERGFRFSTPASYWIRHRVGRCISNHARTVRLPVWLCERIADIARADRALYDGTTCTPATDEQVASHLRLSVAEVSAARRASERGISLEAPAGNRLGVSDHGPNRTLADIVRAPATHPDAIIDEARAHARVVSAVAALSPRDALVVRASFNLGDTDDAPRTLTAIGADLGVCRERVRQVQALALRRLRPALSAFA